MGYLSSYGLAAYLVVSATICGLEEGYVADATNALHRPASSLLWRSTLSSLDQVWLATTLYLLVADPSAHRRAIQSRSFPGGYIAICMGIDGSCPEYRSVRYWSWMVSPTVQIALRAPRRRRRSPSIRDESSFSRNVEQLSYPLRRRPASTSVAARARRELSADLSSCRLAGESGSPVHLSSELECEHLGSRRRT